MYVLRAPTRNAFLVSLFIKVFFQCLWNVCLPRDCRLCDGRHSFFLFCPLVSIASAQRKHVLDPLHMLVEWRNDCWVFRESTFSYYMLPQEACAPLKSYIHFDNMYFDLTMYLALKRITYESPVFFSGWSWMKLRVSISDTPTLTL